MLKTSTSLRCVTPVGKNRSAFGEVTDSLARVYSYAVSVFNSHRSMAPRQRTQDFIFTGINLLFTRLGTCRTCCHAILRYNGRQFRGINPFIPPGKSLNGPVPCTALNILPSVWWCTLFSLLYIRPVEYSAGPIKPSFAQYAFHNIDVVFYASDIILNASICSNLLSPSQCIELQYLYIHR